jgi:two-component system, LytTR family, response regulator
MNLRILLVDDEAPNLDLLRELLAGEPEVEIVGECRNGLEAVQAIRNLHPDLVFLDIQMPGLDGFEVLEELDTEERPMVVFVTAYDQYSLQAFEVYALDYLLKPASEERLHATLERARGRLLTRCANNVNQRLSCFLEEVESRRVRPNRFVVREGDRVRFVRAEDVEAIEATGNYMHLYVGRTSYMIREVLSHLETKLDPHRFIRTHRSWIVNVDKIEGIGPWSKGAYLITVHGGTEVPVSQNYRERIDRIIRSTMA